METQVAEFEDTESEWVIDKVLAHSGRRVDSTFQILWKSGDITWLVYDQIAELGALKDYFTTLGIENVSELGDGLGNLPTGDSQVSAGCLSLGESTYKGLTTIPSSPETSFSLTTDHSLLLFACNFTINPMASLLTRIGARKFTIPNGIGNGDIMIVLEMLCTYLEHNTHLRSGTATDWATPAGYGEFSLSFNMMQTTNGLTSRIAEESSEGPRISGPSPSFVDLVGEEVPPSTQAAHAPAQPPLEGGRWINPRWAELLEEALWMNLETAKRQREWRDRSIANRKAKRARHTSSLPPIYQTTDLGEGPSNTCQCCRGPVQNYGSNWTFGPVLREPDRKKVLGSRSSPTVPFWFSLAEPFRTIIDFDFDFDCDNFGLHVKLLSSGFALRLIRLPLAFLKIEGMETEPPIDTYAWETMPESLTLASVCSIALQELDTSFLQVRLSLATIGSILNVGLTMQVVCTMISGFSLLALAVEPSTHSPIRHQPYGCFDAAASVGPSLLSPPSLPAACRYPSLLLTIIPSLAAACRYPSLLSPPSLAAARHYPSLLLAIIPRCCSPLSPPVLDPCS
ncbi:uncharacterized protein HD556DRAFT_1449162 [Suillus plorans]|uniref:Uncharacterized protein n=1 Tax=Suillus plorans TaxID=116603 RepID=A0A9P7AD96_9AGAM|nr:uncharacterized protein HD556DRAFT_1449162 [Suillus plorans]KAG1787103.1 hypothetical protein HD556DRAFT_1449162 [Suillus plorans]